MRIGRPIGLVIVLALLLGGCATFERGVGAARLAVLESPDFAEMSLVDVVNAKRLAGLTNDKLSLMCWDHIETFVRANAPEPGTEPTIAAAKLGPLSIYQKARNVRRTMIEVEISDEFRIACGPMLTDSMSAIGRRGIRIAL